MCPGSSGISPVLKLPAASSAVQQEAVGGLVTAGTAGDDLSGKKV